MFGHRKGVRPEISAALEAGLAQPVDLLEAVTGQRVRERPGAGAAGGLRVPGPMDLATAMARTPELLADVAERVLRLLTFTSSLHPGRGQR